MSDFRLRYRGTVIPIRGDKTVLGRSSKAGVVVDNRLASREHAVLHYTGGRLVIADMGSRNGTFVNQVQVQRPRKVEVGDVIRIGTESIDVLDAKRDAPKTMRAPTTDVYEDEDETTITMGRTLELAEVLVESATDDRTRNASVASIVRAVEDVLDGIGPAPFVADDVKRVTDIADTVAKWRQDGSLDEWRRNVHARLKKRFNPSGPPP